MKMNNLSTPSRVILSNPARVILSTPSRVILSKFSRVILSVAKDLAVAFALFAFAACSDYLQDFQDKYDDGDAFAEISSDSDNGSDDSKLSSSSKGNSELSSSSKGDVESSDSTDSSSSATDPGSSSSVAESSSSAFKPCTGTVIYDAEEDPLKTAFGTKFSYQKNGTTTDVEADENGFNITLDGFSFASLNFGETKDISSWEGVCFEYTATRAATLYLTNSNSTNANSAATFTMPQSSELQTFEANWSSARIYSGFGFDAVTTLSFGENENKLVIKRITTIAKDVNLNAGSTSSIEKAQIVASCGEGKICLMGINLHSH